MGTQGKYLLLDLPYMEVYPTFQLAVNDVQVRLDERNKEGEGGWFINFGEPQTMAGIKIWRGGKTSTKTSAYSEMFYIVEITPA